MLNASKLRYTLYRSLIGIILLSRMSLRYIEGCQTLSTGRNGARPLRPVPLIEKLLNIPVTGVPETLMVGLPYGRELLIVVIEESCQLFTAYLTNALSLWLNVGAQTQDSTKRWG